MNRSGFAYLAHGQEVIVSECPVAGGEGECVGAGTCKWLAGVESLGLIDSARRHVAVDCGAPTARREDHEAREAAHLAALVEAGEVAISKVDGLPVVDGRRLCLACGLPIEGDASKLYHDTCRVATLPRDAATMTSQEIEAKLLATKEKR